MEIAERWNMTPTQVLEFKQENPIDYILMESKVLADHEIAQGDFNVEKPDEELELYSALSRL